MIWYTVYDQLLIKKDSTSTKYIKFVSIKDGYLHVRRGSTNASIVTGGGSGAESKLCRTRKKKARMTEVTRSRGGAMTIHTYHMRMSEGLVDDPDKQEEG